MRYDINVEISTCSYLYFNKSHVTSFSILMFVILMIFKLLQNFKAVASNMKVTSTRGFSLFNDFLSNPIVRKIICLLSLRSYLKTI